MEMETINEESSCLLTVNFKDENGAAIIPTTAYYSIYCESNSSEILAESEIPDPQSEQIIVITQAQNAIILGANNLEMKLVTLRWTYGTGKQGTKEFRYRVRNLKRII